MKPATLCAIILLPLTGCARPEPAHPPTAVAPPPPAPVPAPLQQGGFACALTVSGMPEQVKAGAVPFSIHVELSNRSSSTWPMHQPTGPIDYSVNLSYHWITPKTGEVVTEGLRAFLPRNLPPGERVELELPVKPPTAPGSYLLRIEPVQEKVAWFSSQGGCKREIEIGASP